MLFALSIVMKFLVYRVNEEVIDNNNRVHKCDRQVGWRTSPIAETTSVDEFGEAKDLRILGRKLIYEIGPTRPNREEQRTTNEYMRRTW